MAAAADNKIEIKLIADYREFLLGKIESLKGSLNQVASSFGNEISSSIEEFTKKINGKLKSIDERFTKNTEELESLRAELVSKKFDESNFNNVSMIRTLDKTIKERDNKIRELESRIRYLEGNSASINAVATESVAKKEPAAPIKQKQKQKQETITIKEVAKEPETEPEPESVVVPIPVPVITSEKDETIKDASAPRVLDADGDIIIAVSAKKSRSKTTKKQSEPASVMPEASSVSVEPVVEEKPKKPIRKIKKASKVEKEEEASAEPVVPIPASTPITNQELEQTNDSARVVDIDEDNDATEAQRLADDEALRLAQEEAAEAERLAEEQRVAEEEALEAERLAEEQRLADERAAKAAAELEKKKKTEVVKKQVIAKKDTKETKDTSTSTSTSKKITAKSTPAASDVPAASATKTKEVSNVSKVKQGYPDKLPEIEDLDVVTVNGNDYYCDKNNQAVYQMINGDDIGAFLGYYDSQAEMITPVDA
jgi:hypothetical protein